MPLHRRPGLLMTLAALLAVASPPSRLPAQVLRPELLWELGGIDGPAEVAWVRVDDAEILGGSAYVVDAATPSVRQFSLDGAFVAELGRSGAGPGEFVRPIHVSGRPDSVAVWDFAQRRWTYFDAAGAALGTEVHPAHPETRYASLQRTFGEVAGRHLALTTWATDESVHHAPALIEWTDPARVDTVARIPTGLLMFRPRGLSHDGDRQQWNSTALGVGQSGGVDVAQEDSLVLLVDGSASELRIFRRTSAGLELAGRRGLPGNVTPLDDAARERIARRYSTWAGHDHARYEYRVPDRIPAWTAVHMARGGRVWIRRGGSGELFDEPERWFGLSLVGGPETEIELPRGVRVLDIDADRVLALRTGEFDEAYLQLYRVPRR